MFDIASPRYRKSFKGRNKGVARSKYLLRKGNFGLKAVSRARVTAKQLESTFRAISRRLKKRSIQVLPNVFPDIPVSNKPTDVRMGKGKGAVAYYAVMIRPGTIMFELVSISNDDDDVIREVLNMAAKMLPLKCRVVSSNSEFV